uniref:pectinesterase n=1 Tax=Fagus sylvatica TaxID=28930 RepID=A0A2N9H0T0_FAGSY
MAFLQWHFIACIALVVVFELGLANGQFYKKVGNKKLPYQTFIVDQSGQGNFTTIQAAIDAVPSNNKDWICIKIKAGTYREKLLIPYEKPYIILKGSTKKDTSIEWGDHDNLAQSPTFTSQADNIVVKSIRFWNTYNNPNWNNPRRTAVAAMISGDKSAFYRCGFYGLQDTLWDDQGRHYYKKCTIQGSSLLGYITAQGRTGPYDTNGFVFKNCIVHGSGSTYLGRPWRDYARVIFYNSNLTNVVVPQGWNAGGSENQLTFVEHGCYGPGADTSKRVKWLKTLSQQDLHQFTSIRFVDNEGWLNKQPF